ncbi:site-specific DNA-methyltransferase [Bradyrhizobium sp.]|uniref:DNA-methyltransferase n=1 Tax=Bradyrhizobium sp. TaxID=376 RepID=UPI0026333B3E|nr:site-specific DNA-methyltransferase [Bradyrhizobium sp.]
MTVSVKLLKNVPSKIDSRDNIIWNRDVASVLHKLPEKPLFDLVITSPPYNIGKRYEERIKLEDYTAWHEALIESIVCRTKSTGSICWQVGNYIESGSIYPLDYLFHPIFARHGLKLRNRIVWHYGHGLHQKRRFSGRYEVVLWYTKSDDYIFDLDAVRVPPKYPGKRAFRGPKAGQLSGNPRGKNPEDVWEVQNSTYDIWNIPNVKAGHVEKTEHPCQFPVGLVERLILALTQKSDVVFDPFTGTGSTGVAALLHKRRFLGCELDSDYAQLAYSRLIRTVDGQERFRSHAKPVFDHRLSPLSRLPEAAE